jgi:hypothetical protein
MSDALTSIAAELIDRLSRIETNVNRLVKVVEGNGVPGLVQRVDDLEAVKDVRKGANTMRTRVTGFALAIIVALLGTSVSLMAIHDSREQAQSLAVSNYMQKQDSRLGSVEVDVAVLMAGLRGADGVDGAVGPPGAKGNNGTQGVPGAKGDKGGLKLFGK